MRPEWKDGTFYSRDEPHPRVPRTWVLRITQNMRLAIVSDHVNHKGQWVMHCRPWFDCHVLDIPACEGSETVAKRVALNLLRKDARELLDAIEAFDHIGGPK